MAHKKQKYKKVHESDEHHKHLNAWDYLNLYFGKNAPALNDGENKELFRSLTQLGIFENFIMSVNSFILCIMIYFMLWIYNGEIDHAEWLIPIGILLPVPILLCALYHFRSKAGRLTYKQFVICQLILVPFAAIGWLYIGLKLAPDSGVIQGISYGIIVGACVYAIIWFKSVPICTMLWAFIFEIGMTYEYSNQLNPQLSQFFSIIFFVGINCIAFYLFVSGANSILCRIFSTKLQEMNQFLINTFEKNSKDFLWQANNKGEITYASNQLQQLLQVQSGNDTFVAPNVLLNKNNQFGTQIRQYIQSEEKFEMFFAKLEYEGTIEYWAVTGDPLYDEFDNQIGFSGFGSNVTAIQQVEKRKNQVENYQSITRMASLIGNDFKKSQENIVDFLNTLPMNLEGDETFEMRRSAAFASAQSIVDTTMQLRDLGDHTSSSFERIILYKLLDELLDEMSVSSPENVKFVPDISCSSYIHANERQFSTCIRNVLENSILAMNSQGTIHIEVETLKAESIENERYMLGKPGKANLDYAFIKIRDTGPGFPKDILENVFEPFVTSRSEAGARGLGLSTVENFCLQLQGFVLARNYHDGAQIELLIPQEIQDR